MVCPNEKDALKCHFEPFLQKRCLGELMEEVVFLFTAKIYKYGTEEVLEECQVLAYNLFQATHLLIDYIQESNQFKMPIELGSIERLRNVNNIINPEFVADIMDNDDDGYDPELPYRIVENLPDDDSRVMKFKCSCKDEIKVHNGEWLFIKCHNCNNKILRREVEEIGGKYIYIKLDSE